MQLSEPTNEHLEKNLCCFVLGSMFKWFCGRSLLFSLSICQDVVEQTQTMRKAQNMFVTIAKSAVKEMSFGE